MIDRLNDREIAAKLGRWPHTNWGAIMRLYHRASVLGLAKLIFNTDQWDELNKRDHWSRNICLT